MNKRAKQLRLKMEESQKALEKAQIELSKELTALQISFKNQLLLARNRLESKLKIKELQDSHNEAFRAFYYELQRSKGRK